MKKGRGPGVSLCDYILIFICFAMLSPVAVAAQSATTSAQTAAAATANTSTAVSSDDLRNAIQASVLADPRTANIPPQQLQELIDALVAQAQAQHMTSADIVTRPQPQQAAAGSTFGQSAQTEQAAECETGWKGYLCNFNKVFGFEGGNYEVPIFLLVVTAFLIAVIWELILHHRKHLAMQNSVSKVI